LYAIPKGQKVDFNAEGVIVQKIFNKLGTGAKQQYNALTEYSTKNYDFVLRVFDNDNNPIDEYLSIDFSNVIVNEGAKIEVLEFEEKEYNVGDTVKLRAKITSDLDLPLTVSLQIRYDGGAYSTTFPMTEVEESIYEFEFETLVDGLTQFKIVVNDTDKDIELELPALEVVKEHKHKYVNGTCSCGKKDPNYKEPTDNPGGNQGGGTGGMNCNMGYISILPLLAAATILLIRKKR
jgi:hypothetical protein